MNIYDLIIQFWRAGDRKPYTISEVALYHYLLHRSNLNYWEMPIMCSTANIAYCLSTTRQNIKKARQSLKDRGIIDYTVGTGKDNLTAYYIMQLPHQLPNQLPNQLPHNKDNIDNKNNINNLNKNEEVEDVLNLKLKLMSDDIWQANMITIINDNNGKSITVNDLLQYLNHFVNMLTVMGVTAKTDLDFRGHFYHWLCKQINNNQHNKKNAKNIEMRRRIDVEVARAEDYEGPF